MSVKSARSARERRAIQRNKRRKNRTDRRNLAVKRANHLMHQVVYKMEKCGYSKLKLSTYSGVCPATIGRIMNYRKLGNVTLAAAIGIIRACGYKIELVPLTPEEDEFIDDRWVKVEPPPKKKTQ